MPSTTSQQANLVQTGPVLDLFLGVSDDLRAVLEKNDKNVPKPIKIMAMIDTGATGTVISKKIIEKLSINPISTIKISTPSNENVDCYTYPVILTMPQHKIRIPQEVIAAPLKGQHIQCLIGRDILQHCVLTYIGYINQFTLSI